MRYSETTKCRSDSAGRRGCKCAGHAGSQGGCPTSSAWGWAPCFHFIALYLTPKWHLLFHSDKVFNIKICEKHLQSRRVYQC